MLFFSEISNLFPTKFKLNGFKLNQRAIFLTNEGTTRKIRAGSVNMSLGKETELKKVLKLKINSGTDEIIATLQNCSTKKEILNFCSVNRELLSYSLLTSLTSLKLKALQDEARNEQVGKIDLIIKNIIKGTSFTDKSNTQSMITAEKIIKEALEKDSEKFMVEKKNISNPIEAAWVWVVLNSAIISWEEKMSNQTGNEKSEVYEKLLKLKESLIKDSEFSKKLPSEIIFLERKFFLKKEQNKPEIPPLDSVLGLKLLVSQLEKLPPASYGPMLRKINSEISYSLESNLGIKIKNLKSSQIKFTPESIQTGSKLIEIKPRD